MADLSTLSEAELYQMAGMPAPQVTAAPIQTGGITNLFTGENAEQAFVNNLGASPVNVSNLSNDELFKLAGVQRQPQSPVQAGVGGVTNLLSAGTFNLGDEIISALSAPVAAGMSQFTDSPMGITEAYKTILPTVRSDVEGFRKENPVVSVGQDVIGALAMPIGSSLKAGDGIINTGLKLGAEGAGYGAAYGFGAGEGGAGQRLEKALQDAQYGAAGGMVLGSVGKGAANYINKAASTAERLESRLLGAKQSDFTKSARQIGVFGKGGDASTSLKQAFNKLKDDQIFAGGTDPLSLWNTHAAKSKLYGKQLERYLKQSDRILKTRQATAIPNKFPNADNFIKSGAAADDVTKLKKELDTYIESLKGESDGTLSYVQNQKEILYNKAYPEGSAAREGLDKAIAKDLKHYIEQVSSNVLKKAPAEAIKRINQRMSPYEETRSIFQRAVAEAEAADPGRGWGELFRTSPGRLVGPTVVGSAIGAAGAGPIAPLVGLIGGVAGAALNTPGGRRAYAKTLRGVDAVSKVSDKIGASSAAKNVLLQSPRLLGQQFAKSEQADTSSRSNRSASPSTASKYRLDRSKQTTTSKQKEDSNRSAEAKNQTDNSSLQSMTKNLPSLKPELKSATSQKVSYTPEKIKEFVNKQPPLIRSMIKQESAGDRKAVSPKGARGLMQLMPDTAKDMASEIGLKNYDLNDPETSLLLGTKYLEKQYKKYGDIKLALAAYNAGPDTVDKWIKRYGKSWETISRNLRRFNSYTETVRYVPSILNRAKTYA